MWGRLVGRFSVPEVHPEAFFHPLEAAGELVHQGRVRDEDPVQVIEQLLLIHELGFELDEARFVVQGVRHGPIHRRNEPVHRGETESMDVPRGRLSGR